MTPDQMFLDRTRSLNEAPPPSGLDSTTVLGAVREDIRQTLRAGWVDPAIEAAAAYPVFLTAGWSAVRPNVGKSFLGLAKLLRATAVESLGATAEPPDLLGRLDGGLAGEDIQRVQECARAAHVVTAKAQIVVHALHRAVRRDRLPGTGREEAPVRRGVPEWQRWMSFQPASDAARALLDEASSHLMVPPAAPPLRLLARWPSLFEALWSELKPISRSDKFQAGVTRLRRVVLAGAPTLPHPVDLQWTALRERGFSEEDRVELAAVLAGHDASMAIQTLTAAFVWMSLGAPEIGPEN